MLNKVQMLADPEQCGWKLVNDEYLPVWTTLPEVAKALVILTNCGCTVGCKPARCKCIKVGLNCTQLCSCQKKGNKCKH